MLEAHLADLKLLFLYSTYYHMFSLTFTTSKIQITTQTKAKFMTKRNEHRHRHGCRVDKHVHFSPSNAYDFPFAVSVKHFNQSVENYLHVVHQPTRRNLVHLASQVGVPSTMFASESFGQLYNLLSCLPK